MASVTNTVPQIAVVILALNERDNLDRLLPDVKGVLKELDVAADLVVVDGGSSDGTQEVARRWGVRVVEQREPGYGGALLEGFRGTTAPHVVTMDADLSHRPMFLGEFWKHRGEAELVIASRYVDGGRADMSPARRLLSLLLNTVYRRVLSLPFRDLSSGFRMYRRDTIERLAIRARDFDALEEILIRVHTEGWRILEVPFHYMARATGRSHVRLVRFGLAFLKTLLRMWRLRNSVAAADYDYRAFDSVIWLQRYWQRARHRIVLGYLEARTGILDVGCGTSRIILDLPDAVGFDLQYNKLRWLRPRHRRLTCGDCTALPFKDGSLGSVIHSEVIEHVPDRPEILQEVWRVLRPGGDAIVGTPDYGRWFWWVLEWIHGRIHPEGYAHEHITRFTRASLAARLQAAGFEILDCQYVGFCEMIFKARKPAGSTERRA